MAIRILVVDDHKLFRDGLIGLLASEPDLEVIGEAGDARTAGELADTHRPDVVILDVGLLGSNGIAAVRDLLRVSPQSRILVLTMHSTHEYVLQAFSAGALGYAIKDQPREEVIGAIRAVAAGERYLAPRLPRALLDVQPGAAAGSALEMLSPREREIFDLVVRGFSNQAIAGQLFISIKTVETHRAHINKKLNLHSAGDLIRFAARHGLLQ